MTTDKCQPNLRTPGPADYNLKPLVGFTNHDLNSLKPRAPQVSIGRKLSTPIENKSPGPALWNIAKFNQFGKSFSPSAIMFERRKDLKSDPNPGPTHNPAQICSYKGVCNPKYSIRRRLKLPPSDQIPGPSYDPTAVDVYKKREPKFKFGIRVKELTPDKGPGPNVYDAGEAKTKVMNQQPAFTHRLRLRNPLADKDQKPGPANYDLTKYNPFEKTPAYSMGRKHCKQGQVLIVPFDNC